MHASRNMIRDQTPSERLTKRHRRLVWREHCRRISRTVIRRAERMVVRLLHEGVITNGDVVRYLNRCSDFVFIMARVVEVRAGGSTIASAE